MAFDDGMMDYIECAYVNGYDVDDCFNLVPREEKQSAYANKQKRSEEEEKTEDY